MAMSTAHRRTTRRTVRRTPDVEKPAPSPATFRQSWRTLVEIGSPVAVATALLYYFGWVRNGQQARRLGYDGSVMDLSTTDYLLKSVNVLYVWLVALLVLALLLHSVHRRAVPRLAARPRWPRVLLRIAFILRVAWLGCVPLTFLMYRIPMLRHVAIPVGLTVALLAAFYGRSLSRTVAGVDPWSTVGMVLAAVFLALVLFWDTERIALLMGDAFAADITARPEQYPEVTVYSAKSLEIDAACVTVSRLDRPDSEYRFRYGKLRLLQRSGDRYFVINECWTEQRGRLMILRDGDAIRLEFTQPAR
jgi:hypothetical protein